MKKVITFKELTTFIGEQRKKACYVISVRNPQQENDEPPLEFNPNLFDLQMFKDMENEWRRENGDV